MSGFDALPRGKYTLGRRLGSGSYGDVFEAVENSSGRKVAIKRMKEVLTYATDELRSYREMRILRQVQHPNVNQLLEVVSNVIPTRARGNRLIEMLQGADSRQVQAAKDELGRSELFMIFELMDTDLQKKKSQFLTPKQLKSIMYQLLVGLKYVHSANVIHRDLKPCNLLMKKADSSVPDDECEYVVQIADFGLARAVAPHQSNPPAPHHAIETIEFPQVEGAAAAEAVAEGSAEPQLGNMLGKMLSLEVVTAEYRAPEIILSQNYTSAVDMWSLGCIFGELLDYLREIQPDPYRRRMLMATPSRGRGQPKGEDLLATVCHIVGTPNIEGLGHLDEAARRIMSHSDLADLTRSRGNAARGQSPPEAPLSQRYGAYGTEVISDAVDLLERMLKFSPLERILVDEALAHPYFTTGEARLGELHAGLVCPHPLNVLLEETSTDETGHLINIVKEVMVYLPEDE